MLPGDCRAGMVVRFGRPNGQSTLGQIIKCNRTTAQVQSLEVRGTGRGSAIGTTWKVPYSLMQPNNSEAGIAESQTVASPRHEEPIKYTPFRDRAENLAMEAIYITYCQLDPECLTADGERPRHQVIALRNKLTTRLSLLFKVVGGHVTEQQAYGWHCEYAAVQAKKIMA